MPKRVLVTGASGYIGGKLIPQLLARGYRVRCLVRSRDSLFGRPWAAEVESAEADLTHPESLTDALQEVWTAYYLVHNMSSGRQYPERDLQAARNFSTAAGAAGVEHIIYLGGLADPQARISPHMRSRIETGIALRAGRVPVTEFRAGVIVGPGSISFEMIRYLTEQLPVLAGPRWLHNQSQPIAAGDVFAYLLAALENPAAAGRVYEIGGTQVLSYAESMLVYARQRGLRRRLVALPGIPVWLMALLVDRLTPVPAAIARPLIEGLQADSVVRAPSARVAYPAVELLDYDTAVRAALDGLSPVNVELAVEPQPPARSLKQDGFLIDLRQDWLALAPQQVLAACRSLADNGDHSGEWIELHTPDRYLQPGVTDKTTGAYWLEWRLLPENGGTRLVLIAWFAPRGLAGFLSWNMSAPFRRTRHKRLFLKVRHMAGRSTAGDSLV